MRFPFGILWLIVYSLHISLAAKIKIKSIQSFSRESDEVAKITSILRLAGGSDGSALANLDLNALYQILSLSPLKRIIDSVNLKEFFSGLELLRVIIKGSFIDYLKEMEYLQKTYLKTVNNVEELYRVRLTLYYHSLVSSKILTPSERDALVKTLSKIDLEFQERFCPGISTGKEFILHDVLDCSFVASSFLRTDQSLLQRTILTLSIQHNPNVEKTEEPYFFGAIRKVILSCGKNSAKLDLNLILIQVIKINSKVISQSKEVGQNNLMKMTALWNKYSNFKLGEVDFPYKKTLEDFVKLGVFGDVPSFSRTLVKQDIIGCSIRGFLEHLMAFKKQVDCQKRRITGLNIPELVYSDLNNMITMGFDLLRSIKSILKEAGYLKRNSLFVNLAFSQLETNFKDFLKQNEFILEPPSMKIILPKFSHLSIEKSLNTFVKFTFEEARYFDQKLFEIIHLFFQVYNCPTSIEEWNKVFIEHIENPVRGYISEHPNLNSGYLLGHIRILSAFLFVNHCVFNINIRGMKDVIIRFGFFASLIGKVESQFNNLVMKQLGYEMQKYFSLDDTSFINTFTYLQYINEV